MKNTAIYPGTFDPLTNGHLDIIHRASFLFPNIIVAVTDNPQKNSFFSLKERMDMVTSAVRGISNVSVDCCTELLVEYMKRKKIRIIIRGLRAVSDVEYEFQLASTNRSLYRSIETVFLMPDEQYTYLSSSIVKEVARLGGGIGAFVPRIVEKKILSSFKERKIKKA